MHDTMKNKTSLSLPKVAASMMLTAAIALLFPACNTNTQTTPDNMNIATAKVNSQGDDWRSEMTSEMKTVIDKLESMGASPLYTLSPQEARQQPTPADAAMVVMKDRNITMPSSKVDTTGKDIPVKGGSIHARIYTPQSGNGPFPVIVYYHGGGWVIANLDTYDASARALAEQVNAVVVSVAYRQGPEHKFPTAHDDSYAAYEWVLKNAASVKGDPNRVAVAGESAGGNLAAAVSMMARDKGTMVPLHQLLVYPIADNNTSSSSYQEYVEAKPLNKPLMQWFFDNYLGSKADGDSPMISLVDAELKGMPPTTIIAAEIDPLQSEGEMLADKLEDADIPVTYKEYDGVTHEFFGMATVIPEAKKAQALAAEELKKALNKNISKN